MKKVLILLIVIIVVGGGGYLAYQKFLNDTASNQENNVDTTTQSAVPAPGATSTKEMIVNTEDNNKVSEPTETAQNNTTKVSEITISAYEFAYDIQYIGLAEGEKVKLTLKNTGKFKHDWVLEGTSIKTKLLNPGETDVIEFTAPKAGTYKFYCSVPGHRKSGMEGTLTVE